MINSPHETNFMDLFLSFVMKSKVCAYALYFEVLLFSTQEKYELAHNGCVAFDYGLLRAKISSMSANPYQTPNLDLNFFE